MGTGEREQLVDALLAASRALVGISVRTVDEAPVDVTVTQHRVLLLLEARGHLSVNEVADLLGVNQSNASRHCARLETLGLVHRSRALHDGRAIEVTLTPTGQRQVEAVRSARRREIESVLGRMSLPDARATVAALEAFTSAVGEPTVLSPGPGRE